jgi:hypothetical protein
VSSAATGIAAVMLTGLASPSPAMLNAVPWSTEVHTNGNPVVTLTVLSRISILVLSWDFQFGTLQSFLGGTRSFFATGALSGGPIVRKPVSTKNIQRVRKVLNAQPNRKSGFKSEIPIEKVIFLETTKILTLAAMRKLPGNARSNVQWANTSSDGYSVRSPSWSGYLSLFSASFS